MQLRVVESARARDFAVRFLKWGVSVGRPTVSNFPDALQRETRASEKRGRAGG